MDYINNILNISCTLGNLETIIYLLEYEDINMQNSKGIAPIHMSTLDKTGNIAKWILKQNADVNITDDNKRTALMWAVEDNNYRVMRILIKNGADKYLKAINGKTAYQLYIDSNGTNNYIIDMLK